MQGWRQHERTTFIDRTGAPSPFVPAPPPSVAPTLQSDVDELVQEMLQQLPPNMAGFSDNHMDTGQGFAGVQWLLEPEMAGKRIPTFTGPLARALETRRLEFFSSNIVLAYVARKFSRGLPGVFSGASWRMPDMHNRDTKRFVLGLPYGAAPDNVVGAVRMRMCVPFELIQVRKRGCYLFILFFGAREGEG